jgi:hypothetical protein
MDPAMEAATAEANRLLFAEWMGAMLLDRKVPLC